MASFCSKILSIINWVELHLVAQSDINERTDKFIERCTSAKSHFFFQLFKNKANVATSGKC